MSRVLLLLPCFVLVTARPNATPGVEQKKPKVLKPGVEKRALVEAIARSQEATWTQKKPTIRNESTQQRTVTT